MSSRVIETNIEVLGDRPYPKRFTDILSVGIVRQLSSHNFSLSIRPTTETLFKKPHFSILKGVSEYVLFHRQVESFGTFTDDEIPPETDIFSVQVSDKSVEQAADRDQCSVHTTAEMITLLNPPPRGGRQPKRCAASMGECFMFRDQAYMHLPVGKGLSGANSFEDIRHIHQFIADPHTDPNTDLTDADLSKTLWYDTRRTAAVFVNGGKERAPLDEEPSTHGCRLQRGKRALNVVGNSTRFQKSIQNCEFIVEYEAQSRSSGKKSPQTPPPRPKCITLRSLPNVTILKGSELLADY